MKFFKKSDILLLAGILVLAGILYFGYLALSADSGLSAEVYYNNELQKTVVLAEGEDYDFSVPGHEDVVFHVYADGTIAFVESDCPDKVCIHSGRLGHSGQSAACLPNGLVLRIVRQGGGTDDPDVVI